VQSGSATGIIDFMMRFKAGQIFGKAGSGSA
jgi:hypothetical protein